MPRPASTDLSLTPYERGMVASRAGVVPSSVVAYLRGRRQVSTVRGRIEQALRELGHEVAVRPSATATVTA